MLQIKDLTITHRKDLRVILDKFNMVLNHGDKAVIIGEEGNGKSTLLKWIYDPGMVESYAEVRGQRVMDGKIKAGDTMKSMSTGATFNVVEVGYMRATSMEKAEEVISMGYWERDSDSMRRI